MEWDEGVATICDSCGELHVCIEAPDPFVDEVYPEGRPHPNEWWCRSCYNERKDDI